MIKYYKYCSKITGEIKAYAIYEVMPESVPEVFQKSKMVCFDEVNIKDSHFSGPSSASVNHHSFTDKENIELKIKFNTVEITDEEFHRIEESAQKIRDLIKETVTELL